MENTTTLEIKKFKRYVEYLRDLEDRLKDVEERESQLEEDLARKGSIVGLARKASLKKVPIKSRLGWFRTAAELRAVKDERRRLYEEFTEQRRAYHTERSQFSNDEAFTNLVPLDIEVTLEEGLDQGDIVDEYIQEAEFSSLRGRMGRRVAAAMAILTTALASYSLSNSSNTIAYESTIKTVPDPWATTKKSSVDPLNQLALSTEPTPPREINPTWEWSNNKEEWRSVIVGRGEVRDGVWYIPTKLEGNTVYFTVNTSIEPTDGEWFRFKLPGGRKVYLQPNQEAKVPLLPEEREELEKGATLEYRLVKDRGNNTLYVLSSGKNARLELHQEEFHKDQIIENSKTDLASLLVEPIEYTLGQRGNYQEIVDLYHQGSSIVSIVHKYNLSQEEVLNTFVTARYDGIKIKGHYNHKIAAASGDVDIILRGRKEGLTYRKIRERFQTETGMSVSLSTIGRILKQYSV